MKIYRISFRLSDQEHTGFEYYASRVSAERAQRRNNHASNSRDEVEEIEFILSKRGILDLMNAYAAYPDNG